MKKRLMTGLLAIAAAIATTWALTETAVVAQDDDGVRKERTIVIKKMTDGDHLHEVHEGEHSMVFIDEDGVKTQLEGDGGSFRWFSGSPGEAMTLAFAAAGPGTFLGVGTTELTPELRSHFGVAEDAGVMVSKVIDDSGAFNAGVLVGDIITAVDGGEIGSGHDLRGAIGSHEEGDSVTLSIWRDGKAVQVTAILGKSAGPFVRSLEGFPHLGGEHFARMMKIDCDDDDEDCSILMSHGVDVCDGDEDCEVRISCDDGECECTVDGEVTDCDELEGIHLRHRD